MTDQEAKKLYDLGIKAGLQLLQEPSDGRNKLLRANARAARKLGVKITSDRIFDHVQYKRIKKP